MLGGNEPGHFFPGRIRDSNRILASFRIDEYNRDSQRKLNKDLSETGGIGVCICQSFLARGRANLFLPGEEARATACPTCNNLKIKSFVLLYIRLYCTFVLFTLNISYVHTVPSFLSLIWLEISTYLPLLF